CCLQGFEPYWEE
ncbi:sensory box protein, partial [Vibrio parahaemolyticus V-223/04]